MLSNKQKYDYYCRTLEIIEQGWTKSTLEDSNGHCLVGAMNRAVTGHSEGWACTVDSEKSTELQRDFAALLRSTRSPVIKMAQASSEYHGNDKHFDGGLFAIELWNDAPWRRKRRVVNMLRKRISQLEPLAREEEIYDLRTQVKGLERKLTEARAKITQLELRIAELENENRFLRKSKLTYTAAQLRQESEAIRNLDVELDAALEQLKGYGVSV